MYCRKCGSELRNTDLFCANCGVKVTYNKNNEDTEIDEKLKHKHFIIAWAVTSLLIVRMLGGNWFDSSLLGILGAFIYKYIFKSKEN